MPKTIYLAGGLFNVGDKVRNLCLEKELQKLGYNVILPQREALKYVLGGIMDLESVVLECMAHATSKDNIFVGCIDGADADSGTAVEYGAAIVATGRAVLYRTDIRTDSEKEIGVNAMFKLPGTYTIFRQDDIEELTDVHQYYEFLATEIHKVISKKIN